MHYQFTLPLQQLEKRKGGYYYLEISADVVERLSRKKATRLLCTVNDSLTIGCGLNHLGNGNYFIILAGRYVNELQKQVGDMISFTLREDPNPLGVAIPETLEAVLEQDDTAKILFDKLTDGKKRQLIYSLLKTKNVDKQIQQALRFFGVVG